MKTTRHQAQDLREKQNLLQALKQAIFCINQLNEDADRYSYVLRNLHFEANKIQDEVTRFIHNMEQEDVKDNAA